MVTLQEIEMLAGLIQQRATINAYEAAWANDVLGRLRAQAAVEEMERKNKPPKEKPDGKESTKAKA